MAAYFGAVTAEFVSAGAFFSSSSSACTLAQAFGSCLTEWRVGRKVSE